MRVIVTGSRDWPGLNWQMQQALSGVLMLSIARGETLTIVEGGAKGVDTYAHLWARTRRGMGVISETHPADWDQFGKAAGPIRNREMANLGAHLCLAFLYEPDGKVSKGTRDMMRQADIAQIPVFGFHWREDL